jgi:hypothetical protein
VTRWILAIVFAVFVSSAGDASAQAFKPKKATPAKGGTAAKKTPAPAAKKAPASAPRRVVTSSKASKKKTSRAAQTSGRPDDLTPDAEPTAKSAARDDDFVLIEDDDE